MFQSNVALKRPPSPIVWGKRTYTMGILNITPDSFSQDGIASQKTRTEIVEDAVLQAIGQVKDGADIIDIGGESTRPGGTVVDGDLERSRILDVIREIRRALPETVISVDTYRSKTADAALEAGADWVNDIWGFQYDPDISQVAAAAKCPVVLMHNGRNRPRLEKDDGANGYYGYFEYDDLIGEVKQELRQSVDIAIQAGVAEKNIILDPGIGFGKTAPQNIQLLQNMSEIVGLGFPVLLGTSRKGFIGQYLGGLPVDQRTEGTIATCVHGITAGIDLVRVHDVKEVVRAVRMTDQIIRTSF